MLVQLHVQFPACRQARATDAFLQHGSLAVAIHGPWELPHPDHPFHDPGPFGAQLFQPACLETVAWEKAQSLWDRPQHGADFDLVRAVEAVRSQTKNNTLFENPLRHELLVLSHCGHHLSALLMRLQSCAVVPEERIPPNIETFEGTGRL